MVFWNDQLIFLLKIFVSEMDISIIDNFMITTLKFVLKELDSSRFMTTAIR